MGALLDRAQRLVALAVEAAAEPCEARLDALDRRVRDVIDALGEHALGLAGEPLDGEVELAAEPARRLLARGADRRVELLRGRLRVARRLARDGAAELLELPVLDVAELDRDALDRLGLLAVDLLLQLALAEPQPVGELLQRLAPLDPVLLEVGRRRLRDLLRACGRARRAASRRATRCSSSVAWSSSASESIRASICGRELHLPLREPRDLVGEALLELARGRPLQSASRSSTRRCAVVERLGQLRRGVALALGDVGAALLGDPPLLLGEHGERLRAGERERPLEVGGARARPRVATTSSKLALPRWISSSSVRGRRACAPQREVRRDRGGDRDERGDERDDGCGGHGSRLGAPPRARRRSAPPPTCSARSACSSGSVPLVSPSVRRAWRTGVESRRCARLSAVAYPAASTPSSRIDCASTKKPVSAANAAPGEREPPVGVEAAAEELEVVRRHEERADGDEREQAVAPRRTRRRRRSRARPRATTTASATSVRSRIAVPQRPAVQLVERVRRDAHRERERGERPEHPVEVERGASAAPTATYERCQACTAGGAA